MEERIKQDTAPSGTVGLTAGARPGAEGWREEPKKYWEDWLVRDRNGVPVNSFRNLSIILEEDERLRPIRYDLLSDAIELTGDLPWRKISRGGKGWRDADDAHLMNYVETYYGAFSQGHYGPALARAADSRAFHPVRDYIKALPEWDGTPRLDTLLQDYLGAEDSPYVRNVTRLTLQAALWRAFHPGTKFDNILVLCGPQGIGKSTLIARLGGPWYSDSLTLLDMNDKTAAEKLQGAWLVEIGEMAGMRKAEIEKVKAFLSRQDDRYRAAYGKRVVSHPRQCVFFGTTNNEGGYLRDVTGNRRFWTVPVTGVSPKKPWDLDPETVGQIWMEAVVRLDGGPLVLPPDLEPVSERIQREALEQDDRQGLVESYLSILLPENWLEASFGERVGYYQTPHMTRLGYGAVPRTEVCNMEIWCECFGRPRDALTRRDSDEITAIMARIPHWRRTGIYRYHPIYGKQRIYVYCPEEAAQTE